MEKQFKAMTFLPKDPNTSTQFQRFNKNFRKIYNSFQRQQTPQYKNKLPSDEYKEMKNIYKDLEGICDEPQIDMQIFQESKVEIFFQLRCIFIATDTMINSFNFFHKLYEYRTFEKLALRDIFANQDDLKRSLHEIFLFISQNQYKLTKAHFKFFRKFIYDHFFSKTKTDALNHIPFEKIFQGNSELRLLEIINRIFEHMPQNYHLKVDAIQAETLNDKFQEKFQFTHYTDADFKQQANKEERLDQEIENRVLNDSLLQEANKIEENEDFIQEAKEEKDEEDEEEERKVSFPKKKNEIKKQNWNKNLEINKEEEEETKENYLLNNEKNRSYNEKDELSFDEQSFKKELECLEKTGDIFLDLDEKDKENASDFFENITDKNQQKNIASQVVISNTCHFIEFVIPKTKLISKSIKSIEIMYGGIILQCDNCTFGATEIILTKSKYPKIKEACKVCNFCDSSFKGKDMNFNEKKMSEKAEINKTLAAKLEAKEMKGFFKITVIPKKKYTESILFCQVLTENCYFWTNSNSNSKRLKKKPPPYDPKKGRPKPKPSDTNETQDLCKLFESVTFLLTCECEEKSYEHKGLPFGNEYAFQKQCDKCWNSMRFQIDDIEIKILDPNEYNNNTNTFRKEDFFS